VPVVDKGMAQTVEVQAARIPDRDQLAAMLSAGGYEVLSHGELGITVLAPASSDDPADEVYRMTEAAVIDLAGLFVPQKFEDVIYVRPPSN
jgi:hypothetical protein